MTSAGDAAEIAAVTAARIANVERAMAKSDQFDTFRRALLQGLAKLAARAGDQHFHGKVTASASGLPATSLAESCGTMSPSGQSMPTDASFHSRLCSLAGS